MSLSFTLDVQPEYVRISISGTYSFEALKNMFSDIYRIAVDCARDRVLIDSRQALGTMTESDKFFLGTTIAEVFGARIKAAGLMRPGVITRMGEMAAVNRGARFFVTESESEALAWLNPPTEQTSI